MINSGLALSSLLESLYATTLDEKRWPHFLADLCVRTESLTACLDFRETSETRLFTFGGLAPSETERFASDILRNACLRKPRVGVFEVNDLVPRGELLRSGTFQGLEKLGVTYGTSMIPSASTKACSMITLWRSGNRPKIEAQADELLRELIPHLQIVLNIRATMNEQRAKQQMTESILDAGSTATFLVGPSTRLLHMNRMAKQFLVREEHLIERNGRLNTVSATGRSEFANLVETALAAERGTGGAMLLEREDGKPPLQILAIPFHGTAPVSRRALVLVSDPYAAPNLPEAVLAQLYRLTRAEVEIANLLACGSPVEAVAFQRGVSVDTVRSQIKSLFLKTNTKRQADLVRILATVPNPHRARPESATA